MITVAIGNPRASVVDAYLPKALVISADKSDETTRVAKLFFVSY
jgi:hypothetical protein